MVRANKSPGEGQLHRKVIFAADASSRRQVPETPECFYYTLSKLSLCSRTPSKRPILLGYSCKAVGAILFIPQPPRRSADCREMARIMNVLGRA